MSKIRCPEGMDLLLPWYVRGTLSEIEMERVKKHLEECPVCREELKRVAQEMEMIRGLDDEVEVPWTLDELVKEERRARGLWHRLKDMVVVRPGPFLMGLAFQSAFCLVLIVLVFTYANRGKYVTLSSPSASKAQIVVVFDGNIKEKRLREVLLEVGATIVRGPSPQGVYKLGFGKPLTREEVEKIVEKLKTEAGVRFVAPYGKE